MRPTVLVIDDSAVAVELMTRALTAAGAEAAGATDLASLDARLGERSFDLVLVDVNMPEMFGDDVVEFLREQRGVSGKLVLYSDLAEQELGERAQRSGASGYLSKSLGLDATVVRVCELVGLPAPVGAAPPPRAAAPAPAKSTAKPTAGPRKRRVLILDDSEVTAALIAADLTAKGFEVSIADTADKATKIILKKQTRPDLVLLDVRMPNVNGEQFCRFIKGNALFKGIKVLLCSGESVQELQRICREAGADGYLPKDAVLSKVLQGELT